MSTGISIYGSDLLSGVMAGTTTIPATLYVAVTGDAPTAYSTGSNIDEPDDSAYARQAVSMSSSFWDDSYSGMVVSKSAIVFPEADADWGSIVHWVLCSAVSGGSVVMWTRFDNPTSVLSGNTMSIPAGSLSFSVTTRVSGAVRN